MPYESPTTCSACGGNGYGVDEDLCIICFGGGVIPVKGSNPHITKKAYEAKIASEQAKAQIIILEQKVDDLVDRCNDIMDKCNDIFEKVSE